MDEKVNTIPSHPIDNLHSDNNSNSDMSVKINKYKSTFHVFSCIQGRIYCGGN